MRLLLSVRLTFFFVGPEKTEFLSWWKFRNDSLTIHNLPKKTENGQFVIVLDSQDRENEGDLIIAADAVTEAQMAFLVRYSRYTLLFIFIFIFFLFTHYCPFLRKLTSASKWLRLRPHPPFSRRQTPATANGNQQRRPAHHSLHDIHRLQRRVRDNGHIRARPRLDLSAASRPEYQSGQFPTARPHPPTARTGRRRAGEKRTYGGSG